MDGLIEQAKELARSIERRREELKEAGYNIGRAIQILEADPDQVKVEIQIPGVTVKESLEVLEKFPDSPLKTEETTEQPHEEPLPSRVEPTETRPTSQQMGTGPNRYRDVSTRTAILDVLDKCLEPADAKRIHLRLVEGGWTCASDNPIASVRAALSAMRFDDISQKKILVGSRKIAHYTLRSIEDMSR